MTGFQGSSLPTFVTSTSSTASTNNSSQSSNLTSQPSASKLSAQITSLNTPTKNPLLQQTPPNMLPDAQGIIDNLEELIGQFSLAAGFAYGLGKSDLMRPPMNTVFLRWLENIATIKLFQDPENKPTTHKNKELEDRKRKNKKKMRKKMNKKQKKTKEDEVPTSL